ncbi:MAG: hypothetical protein DRJ01_04150 [Bacteroidetes bacterium]|nr:MAG: hypothetical protein DRJ01_04150 [Bacteroidota bacterium]
MIFFTKKNILFLSLLLSVSFNSCDIINPDEDIPGYIQIDKISLGSDPKCSGLSDVWVNIDGNLLGVYELPAKFPVLEKGRHSIMIRAGIKVNGIATSRSFYPFFNSYEIDTVFQAGQIIKLNPVVNYRDGVNVVWSENFDQNGTSLEKIAESNGTISFENNDVFDGYSSAKIFLSKNDTLFECQTNNYIDLPNDRSPIFFEMNYKNNNEFYVGLLIYSQTKAIHNPIIILNKSEEWNKIYIDLASTVNNYPEGITYRLFIGAINNSETDTEIYLDNLKIIY